MQSWVLVEKWILYFFQVLVEKCMHSIAKVERDCVTSVHRRRWISLWEGFSFFQDVERLHSKCGDYMSSVFLKTSPRVFLKTSPRVFLKTSPRWKKMYFWKQVPAGNKCIFENKSPLEKNMVYKAWEAIPDSEDLNHRCTVQIKVH